MPPRPTIDTSVATLPRAGPSFSVSSSAHPSSHYASLSSATSSKNRPSRLKNIMRGRSASTASTTSSLAITSPVPSSAEGNASTTSLVIPEVPARGPSTVPSSSTGSYSTAHVDAYPEADGAQSEVEQDRYVDVSTTLSRPPSPFDPQAPLKSARQPGTQTRSRSQSNPRSHVLSRSASRAHSRSTSASRPSSIDLPDEFVLAMHDFAPAPQATASTSPDSNPATTATCLSFRAGQLIRVLNRDPSGWWDGELEGRRGWFPSNYVNKGIGSLMEEKIDPMPANQAFRRAHASSQSEVSVTSWASTPGAKHARAFSNHSRTSNPRSAGPRKKSKDIDREIEEDYNFRPSHSPTSTTYTQTSSHSSSSRSSHVHDVATIYPPIMLSLLHGLQLLQNTVRERRIAHYQPAVACIISCIRAILTATDCLERSSALLRRFPMLAVERRAVLSELANLVTRSKKASLNTAPPLDGEDTGKPIITEEEREAEEDAMLRSAGTVVARVRRFLAVAVQCGVELPELKSEDYGGYAEQTEDEGGGAGDETIRRKRSASFKERSLRRISRNGKEKQKDERDATITRSHPLTPATLRARSMGDLKAAAAAGSRKKSSAATSGESSRAPAQRLAEQRPKYYHHDTYAGAGPGPTTASNYERDYVDTTASRHAKAHMSVSSASSFESSSSRDGSALGSGDGVHMRHVSTISTSSYADSIPQEPSGPLVVPGTYPAQRVLSMLRNTHDVLLSVIAAFIGHVHSHSRSAHASSTGQFYDLARQVVEVVCVMVVLCDAVCGHDEINGGKKDALAKAKEKVFTLTGGLARAVKEVTANANAEESEIEKTEEEEKSELLRSATAALKASGDCVAAVRACLHRPVRRDVFVVRGPRDSDAPSEADVWDGDRRESAGTLKVAPDEMEIKFAKNQDADYEEEQDMTIQAAARSSMESKPPEPVPKSAQHSKTKSAGSAGTTASLSASASMSSSMTESEDEENDNSTNPTSSASSSSKMSASETSGSIPSARKEMRIVVPPRGPVRTLIESEHEHERDLDAGLPSPMSAVSTTRSDIDGNAATDVDIDGDADGATTWEGSQRTHTSSLPHKMTHGELPSLPPPSAGPSSVGRSSYDHDGVDRSTLLAAQLNSHDYSESDVAYNSEGHLVGATLSALVEKMTPHDSIVDQTFSAIFFMTFRLFATPVQLAETLVARYNLPTPENLPEDEEEIWQKRKLVPVRLRVSNFLKAWLESYWRPASDDEALQILLVFVRDSMSEVFQHASQRLQDLINVRILASQQPQNSDHSGPLSPTASSAAAAAKINDRLRDAGMPLNPPTLPITSPSEIPRPIMTKTLLANLRIKNFAAISITDFDATELGRQLTILECSLYCAIRQEEVLDMGQPKAAPAVNVKAVSSLSTVITGWVAESILNEPDLKKRTALLKFFIKVADRCTLMNNFSTPRSILAALDSSTISRLRQTWMGVPRKNELQLEGLRKLADHARNFHEYRSRLRNTAPPAVPFLGLYLTDLTFCREGNMSFRASPKAPEKRLVNFNKYHKLARIVQDMTRFQVPYTLKEIPEVQEYLQFCFEKAKHHGDLDDLYRRSLSVEPKRPADTPPTSELRQLFGWGSTRSQAAVASTV